MEAEEPKEPAPREPGDGTVPEGDWEAQGVHPPSPHPQRHPPAPGHPSGVPAPPRPQYPAGAVPVDQRSPGTGGAPGQGQPQHPAAVTSVDQRLPDAGGVPAPPRPQHPGGGVPVDQRPGGVPGQGQSPYVPEGQSQYPGGAAPVDQRSPGHGRPQYPGGGVPVDQRQVGAFAPSQPSVRRAAEEPPSAPAGQAAPGTPPAGGPVRQDVPSQGGPGGVRRPGTEQGGVQGRPRLMLSLPRQQEEEETGPPEVRGGFPAPDTFGRVHPRAGEPRGLPSADHAVPDTVLDLADFDGLAVRGASLRGDDHRYNGEPRQDAMGLWTVSREGGCDLLVVAAADGLGSQPLSHLGSSWACRMLRDQVKVHAEGLFDGGLDMPAAGQWLVDGLADQMLHRAHRNRLAPEELSTTMVGAIIELTPPDRPRRYMVVCVGDSTAYLLRNGMFHELWEGAHEDETIVSSKTAALPTKPGRPTTSVGGLGGDDVLVLCTDGLANPMSNDDVRARLAELWSDGRVPGALEFGWQLGFRAKSYGDDRTAVCVWGHG